MPSAMTRVLQVSESGRLVTPQKFQTSSLCACVALTSHPVECVLSRASHRRVCGRSMLHKAGILQAWLTVLPPLRDAPDASRLRTAHPAEAAESAPPARRSSRVSTWASCRSPAYSRFTRSARAGGKASCPGAHMSGVISLHRVVNMSHNDDMQGTMCRKHQALPSPNFCSRLQ